MNVDSRTYWFGELPEEITTEPSPTAHLLQAYDEYSNGYGESRDLFNPYVDRIMARRGAIHMVVINGTIAGAWKRTLRAKALQVEVEPFRDLTTAERDAVHHASEAHAQFVGLTAQVTFI